MQIQHASGERTRQLPIQLDAFNHIYEKDRKRYTSKIVYGVLAIFVIFLFLPWTQNVRARGYVTTVNLNERPQELVSQIPGKIVKWYIKEGDFVKAGDTLLQLGEIKDEYLDPQLAERTQVQIDQNQNKAQFYEGKNATAAQQIVLLQQQQQLKLQSIENKQVQTQRKIDAKEAEVKAAEVDVKQTADQLQRARTMLENEAISKLDFERRNLTAQKAVATLTEKQNELGNLKQDLVLLQLERSNALQEYNEKIAKVQGDQFTNSSLAAEAIEKQASLEVKKQNIVSRSGYYFLVAPQTGQVIKALKAGINEIVKEGEPIVEIVPDKVNYAVELFIEPMDLPLINPGQPVRFMFDGFPAIVFSGWPSSSYGTFGGKVIAIESNRQVSGKFRILVAEDSTERPWPPSLKLGAGADGMALLKDVPIWYELWRNINGFPPDYYKPKETNATAIKK